MSDLVGNPEDRFSHNEAQIILELSSNTQFICFTGNPEGWVSSEKFYLYLSIVVRKSVFAGFDQFQHNPGCTTVEDGENLQISDLGNRGIVLTSENKGANLCFCICNKQVFS